MFKDGPAVHVDDRVSNCNTRPRVNKSRRPNRVERVRHHAVAVIDDLAIVNVEICRCHLYVIQCKISYMRGGICRQVIIVGGHMDRRDVAESAQ